MRTAHQATKRPTQTIRRPDTLREAQWQRYLTELLNQPLYTGYNPGWFTTTTTTTTTNTARRIR